VVLEFVAGEQDVWISIGVALVSIALLVATAALLAFGQRETVKDREREN
jgi:hypothetical protein